MTNTECIQILNDLTRHDLATIEHIRRRVKLLSLSEVVRTAIAFANNAIQDLNRLVLRNEMEKLQQGVCLFDCNDKIINVKQAINFLDRVTEFEIDPNWKFGSISTSGEFTPISFRNFIVSDLSLSNTERIQFIKDNLSTQKEWTREDYADFYNRDVEFLLGLVEQIAEIAFKEE